MISPRKALNKAYLKLKPQRSEIDSFKANLIKLLDQVDHSESEEFNKNVLADFLKNTYYSPNYFINTSERIDLAIHNGKAGQDTVGVIIEVKRVANASEMLRQDNINAKAMQELVLYYLRERITSNNLEIKHLIATNLSEWFIFDAHVFEKHFAHSKKLVKQFEDFEAGRLAGNTTDFFYTQVAQPAIEQVKDAIEFTYFSTSQFEAALKSSNKGDDAKLIPFYKLLSPQHLLKTPFANDSNSLNKSFYTELLHIIGLEEVKDGSKKLITRKKENERNSGSLIENAITQLDSLDRLIEVSNRAQYGETKPDQLFSVALDLAITWVNRILFLKLLEAQLLSYHKNDSSYAFLNTARIKDYDELNALFFQVLAVKTDERNSEAKAKFAKIPYLNSSLFEPADIERHALFINMLSDGKTLPVISSTVLKDKAGKKLAGELSAIEYLFAFLDAYDFASDSSDEIQDDSKTLISASVLGLIFEKINGYKDGSFFTPGFITMYMSREAIRKAVVQKFNDAKGWNCTSIDDVYNKIDDTKEANVIINSLKICDPAVGSGHFLVSALNEIIAIKAELRLLQDKDGKRLKEYSVEVENDELIVSDEDGDIVEYNPLNNESQRVQETLFNEKQTIIENCLFGVDINPNSVKICRLRLWIELLKNAYYKADGELETLPNIDINIKCGNSLISRFALNTDLKDALKKSKLTITQYRNAVQAYRNAKSKDEKRDMERLIAEVKTGFRTEIFSNDPKVLRLNKIKVELNFIKNQTSLFNVDDAKAKEDREKERKLTEEVNRLELEIETIKSNKLYDNAFEWRFEFPEILDDKGIFVGFDVVIGNPPWVSLMGKYKGISDDNLINLYKSIYPYNTYMPNLYEYFIKHSYNLLKDNGYFIFITPDRVAYNEALGYIRKILLTEVKLIEVIFRWDFPDIIADTITIFYKKEVAEDYSFRIKYSPAHKFVEVNSKFYANPESNYVITPFKSNAHKDLLIKILSESTQLMKFCKSTSGFGGKSSLITSKRMNENQREVAKGESIARYETRSFFFFEIKDENITGRTRDISKLTKLNKILTLLSGRFHKRINWLPTG